MQCAALRDVTLRQLTSVQVGLCSHRARIPSRRHGMTLTFTHELPLEIAYDFSYLHLHVASARAVASSPILTVLARMQRCRRGSRPYNTQASTRK